MVYELQAHTCAYITSSLVWLHIAMTWSYFLKTGVTVSTPRDYDGFGQGYRQGDFISSQGDFNVR